ncbi:MAG: hypothetical protein RMJ43_06970 [Chloroherpetonaceae bacterium]|nr:hypothetical protein [Chthonomonadaceae bacterium]MDW8207563.1 hypothetical protein [Chloroherpetonaceae bacterium]
MGVAFPTVPPSVARILWRAHRTHRRIHATIHLCRTFNRAGATLFLSGMLDLLWPWPAPARGLFLLAWLGYQGIQLRRLFLHPEDRIGVTENTRAARTARAIEKALPELDNALIHAVQFGTQLPEEPLQRALARQELTRAESQASTVVPEQVIPRDALLRTLGVTAGIFALFALTAWVFPRAYRFELPRFLAFWQDHPPFTLTDFRVHPGDTRVRAGDTVPITVVVRGLQPERLEIVVEPSGEPASAILLTPESDETHTAYLEAVHSNLSYYVQADTGRSQRFRVRVDTPPRLRAMTITVHATGAGSNPAVHSVTVPGSTVHGVAGAPLRVEAQADRPLSGGMLVLRGADLPDRRILLHPVSGDPRRVTGEFVLESAGNFHLHLQSAASEGNLIAHDAMWGRIVLAEDGRPAVTVIAPGQNVVAHPGQTLLIVVEATDDRGVARLTFHRAINQGTETSQDITLPDTPRTYRHTLRLPLRALDVRPGDTIHYFFAAHDRDPQGSRSTRSDRYRIHVVSDAEYRRILSMQRDPQAMTTQYRVLLDTLRSLAGQQEQLAREAARPPAPARQSELRARQRDLASQAEQLTWQMQALRDQPVLSDIDGALQRSIARIATQVAQAQSQMRSAGEASTSQRMRLPARRAAEQLRAAAGAGQKLIAHLAALEQALRLHHALLGVRDMAQSQADIARQARNAARTESTSKDQRAALNTLADRQMHLRRALEEITQELRTSASQARHTASDAVRTARRISDALAGRNVTGSMERAERSLRAQQAGAGAEHAEEARRLLQNLQGLSATGMQQAQDALEQQARRTLGTGVGKGLLQLSQQMASARAAQRATGFSGTGAAGQMRDNTASTPQQGATAADLTAGRSIRSTSRRSERTESAPPMEGAIENLPASGTNGQRSLPRVTDTPGARYPTEYRQLIQDYFRAVAGDR